jgi:hypothetical protein
MLRIAMIYVGVLAGLVAGGVGGLSLMETQAFWDSFDPHRHNGDLVGSLLMYIVVPCSGVVGGVVIALLTKPLRKKDDLTAIGVVLTIIAGVLGALLTIFLSIETFRLIDPNPSAAAGTRMFEEMFALWCLGPLGGLISTLVTYKFMKKFGRNESRERTKST